jgi:hypothetical protein
MLNWTLQTIPIKKLKDYSKNPRQINKEQQQHLQTLIEKFGLIDKPVVNSDFTIIGGHQRIKILKKMKIKEVECWIPDRLLVEEEIEYLCIGLNLNQGKWDWDKLANEFEALDLLAYGFSEEQLLGFSKEEELECEQEEKKDKKKKCCPNCGWEI